MSEDTTFINMEGFKALGRSAFVLGYTGEVGKALVQELNKLKIFKRVVLIGRREVPLNVGPEFEQKVVDYEKIADYKDVFQGLDTGFCCLGTTIRTAGAQGFVRVDRDYVLMSGEVAKSQGCKHMSLVSSGGTKENSWILYLKTKYEAETGLRDMNFDRLSIYRPGFLLCDRQERRILERILTVLFKPLVWCCPTAFTVPVEVVARAMINNVVTPTTESVELYENKEIHQMSKTPVGGCCGKKEA